MLTRCEEPELWMEVYENVRDRTGFEATMSAAAVGSDLARHLESGSARKVECFRD
jgi:hypothetical protein